MNNKREPEDFITATRLGYMYLEDMILKSKNIDVGYTKDHFERRIYEMLLIIVEQLGYRCHFGVGYDVIPDYMYLAICKLVEHKYIHQNLDSIKATSFIFDLIEVLEEKSPYNIETSNLLEESCEDIPF
jgi:hypothetical protein